MQEQLAAQVQAAGASGDFSRPDFTIGETHFHVDALLPMEAFDVLEKLREAAVPPELLSVVMGGEEQIDIQKMVGLLVSVLFGLPKAVVKSVQGDMFKCVSFTNKMAVSAQTLAGNEAMAFAGTSAFAVYEVTLRCLAVNFLESSAGLISRIPAAE